MAIRVVLVDEHVLVREALASFIAQEDDIEVVGQAEDGRAGVKLVKELEPDIVVLDIAMPEMNGIEAAAQIRARHPKVKILALSAHSDRRHVLEMLNAGAVGYVTKSAVARDLLRAIRAVARGESYLSEDVAGSVVAGLKEGQEGGSQLQLLGRREREVLQLLAEGHRSLDIAARLFISVSTVEAHRRNLMRKLGLHSIADLTRFAIREGLISP